jgi:hypothetical protein
MVDVETLVGAETGGVWGGGEGAGSQNRLDAAQSTQSKHYFLILDLPGGF